MISTPHCTTSIADKVVGHAGIVAIEGAYNFGVGGIVGSMGPKVGQNGKMLRSKEWYLKVAITQEFSNPFKIPLNILKKEIWG